MNPSYIPTRIIRIFNQFFDQSMFWMDGQMDEITKMEYISKHFVNMMIKTTREKKETNADQLLVCWIMLLLFQTRNTSTERTKKNKMNH